MSMPSRHRRVKTGHRIRRVPFVAPTPFGIEVMTLDELHAMAAPDYLRAPQRPAFHLLILGRDGAGTHRVDFERYRVGREHSVWVRPGQVQQFGEERAAAGELVLFEPDFLIPGTRAAAIAENRFGPVGFVHAGAARTRLAAARRELVREYAIARTSEATAARTEALRHLLSVVILRLAATAPDAAPPDTHRLHSAFRELLERDFARAHDVDHYARALGYSTRTLARATQAAVGQSPKQVIAERIGLEARRLLAHTDRPVSTVARQLGFRDPSNFSAFFTGHVGTTPTRFRREGGEFR